MERITFLFFFTLISILFDIYFYQIIKKYNKNKWVNLLIPIYWSFTIIAITNFFLYSFQFELGYYYKTISFNIIIGNFISKVLSLPFLLIDDLRRLIIYIFRKKTLKSSNKISRSKFLSISASLAYGIPITSLTYGILSNNVYDYRIKRRQINFKKLPLAFDGIKVCHVSDIHVGSLRNRLAVRGGIDMITNEKPDVIFFTGDLVNDKAKELMGWGDDLSKIKAPLGVFSVLGNHDYGEYTSWENEISKTKNFNDLLTAQKEFGWNLLRNQNTRISVDGESINIIGVENWSASRRFQQYGKLDLAYEGLNKNDFKLLMSHNPSHWNAHVTNNFKDIDLTLSGHTHGLQYGIDIGKFRVSPVRLAYKQWADLYTSNNQHIYVNRGFGFMGYPGRVGILPEITILTLKRS
tara:strand:+ start:6115 stop:7338 length:1224 start_codon:yes stop_codon:yes gene_type:complete